MKTIIHVTTVHPWWDNRIYEKMVLGLQKRGRDVLYICPADPIDLDRIKVKSVALPLGSGISARLSRNVRACHECLKRPGAIVHFHDPEFIPFGLLLRMFGQHVIYDVHEDNLRAIPQKTRLPRWMRLILANVVAAIESFSSRFFRIVIAERVYTERFKQGVPVLNYPSRGMESCNPSKDLQKRSMRRLLYTGCLSEDRGSINHVKLLRLLPEYELHMIGRCDTDLQKKLIQIAGDALPRLHLQVDEGGIPFPKIRDAYMKGGWDWGLAIFPDTPHYRDKELTKFFEYMFFRVPIICSDFPVWRQLVGEDYGIVVDAVNLESAASMLRQHNEKFRNYRTSSFGMPDQYTWETQLDRLEKLYGDLA
ncbi:MAG: hypothetical protein H3C57_00745 [Gammaproteobacteria bacterium]|nr:hypothetical protein [Gammaproteobacteria bacterium]